ncbi:MAG: hypothetical protein SF028_10330 [Candidatus Sumerlaeia bacterium]|nr:hypothetical protein [Candidatus Sumerlaeia bacterium]
MRLDSFAPIAAAATLAVATPALAGQTPGPVGPDLAIELRGSSGGFEPGFPYLEGYANLDGFNEMTGSTIRTRGTSPAEGISATDSFGRTVTLDVSGMTSDRRGLIRGNAVLRFIDLKGQEQAITLPVTGSSNYNETQTLRYEAPTRGIGPAGSLVVDYSETVLASMSGNAGGREGIRSAVFVLVVNDTEAETFDVSGPRSGRRPGGSWTTSSERGDLVEPLENLDAWFGARILFNDPSEPDLLAVNTDLEVSGLFLNYGLLGMGQILSHRYRSNGNFNGIFNPLLASTNGDEDFTGGFGGFTGTQAFDSGTGRGEGQFFIPENPGVFSAVAQQADYRGAISWYHGADSFTRDLDFDFFLTDILFIDLRSAYFSGPGAQTLAVNTVPWAVLRAFYGFEGAPPAPAPVAVDRDRTAKSPGEEQVER